MRESLCGFFCESSLFFLLCGERRMCECVRARRLSRRGARARAECNSNPEREDQEENIVTSLFSERYMKSRELTHSCPLYWL